MKLTRNFWLGEFTDSYTADRCGIENNPNEAQLRNLEHLALRMEEVRTALGDNAIFITSGFRSEKLNGILPGSSKTSQHMTGEACDFVCRGYGSPYVVAMKIASERFIGFDQLILGPSYVHISFLSPIVPKPRREILTVVWGKGDSREYTTGLNE